MKRKSSRQKKREIAVLPRIIHRDRVRRAKRRLPHEAELERLRLLYRALADSGRLRLLAVLQEGEMCVSDLAAVVGCSQPTVSHQLQLLRQLTLVKSRRAGQMVYYSLDDRHVMRLLQIGREHAAEKRS